MKARDLIMNGRVILWKVEILLRTVDIYYERSRHCHEQSKYIIEGRDLIMNCGHILWKTEIFLWTVVIYYESLRFCYDERLRYIKKGQGLFTNKHNILLKI